MEDSGSLRPSTSSRPSKQDGEGGGVKVVWQELCLEEGVEVCPSLTLLKAQPTRKPSRSSSTIQPREEDQSQTELRVSFQGDGKTLNTLQVVGPLVDLDVSSALMKLISYYPTLTTLNLTNCQVRAEGVLMLSWGLQQASVTDLCLDSNPISGQDYSSLLRDNNLQFLSLRMCRLNDRGTELLAKALAEDNCNLLVLNLDTNFISGQGAVHLAEAVKWNSHLVALCLGSNTVDSIGAQAIVAALLPSPLDDAGQVRLQQARLQHAAVVTRNVYARKAELGESVPSLEQWPDEQSREKKLHQSVSSKSNGKKDKRKSTAKGKESRRKKRVSSATSVVLVSEGRDRSAESGLSPPVPSCTVDQDNESLVNFDNLLAELEDESEDNEVRLEDFLLDKMVDRIEAESENLKPIILKRIIVSDDGQVTWPGNDTLAYLNLASNCVTEENAQSFVEVIKYQEKIGLKSLGLGLRYLLLKGNRIPENSPSLIEIQKNLITELGESRN